MILRGISTPVQGEDAANKDYVDGKVGLPDRVQIENSNGEIAKGFIQQGTNSFVRMIPVEIGLPYVLYAFDIYWFRNPSTFVISSLVNTPIKSAEILLSSLIDHNLIDETKVEFNMLNGGQITIHASGVFGMGYLKLNI